MRAASVMLVLLALALATPAAAERDYVVHKVKEGDSLPILAAEYYGDRNHMVFIMVANRLLHPRPLKKGEKIRIPVSREVTVEAGDTWDDLAEAHLGDRRRGKYLAEFNGASADRSPAGGQVITVPFHVTHTAAGDESIAQIALAYFGNSSNAEMLRGYNFLERERIAKGETLVIPIHHIKVRDSKLPPDAEQQARDAEQRAAKHRKQSQDADRALPRAAAAWRRTDYAEVKRELIGIDLDYVDADRAAAVGRLLGAAYVALGDEDSAIATFRRVLERAPGTTLSAYRYSPRIRAVWAKAQQAPAAGGG